MAQKIIIITAISAILSLNATNLSATNNPAEQDMSSQMGNIPGMEKCYGIAKAYANDCGNNAHHCSGEAKIDGDKTEWLLVPEGLCNKIVGGSKTPQPNSS